jgi:hypothetical protein
MIFLIQKEDIYRRFPLKKVLKPGRKINFIPSKKTKTATNTSNATKSPGKSNLHHPEEAKEP